MERIRMLMKMDTYNQYNKKPNPIDYGFNEYEIPKIEEAHKRVNDFSELQYSEEVLCGREKRVKKAKATEVLSWVLTILTGLCILAIYTYKIMEMTDGFTNKNSMPIGSFVIFGLMIMGAFYGFSLVIRLLWSRILGLFIRDDVSLRAMEEQEKNAYKEAQKKKYGQFESKYESLMQYYKDLDIYESAVRKQKAREQKRREMQAVSYWDSKQGGDGHAFELAVGRYLETCGYYVSVSPIGADGGVDIIATNGNKRIAVQCKALANKVSSGEVQKLVGVIMTEDYDEGMFFSLNGFSAQSIDNAKKSPKRIRCISKEELIMGIKL